MAEILATLTWTAKIDANDIEFVLGGVQPDTEVKGNEYSNKFMGSYSLWVLDFDCCKPLTMDDARVEQAARTFMTNDPFFPRPPSSRHEEEPSLLVRECLLWVYFKARYLESSRGLVPDDGVVARLALPDRFIKRVEEMQEEITERMEKAREKEEEEDKEQK